MHQSKGASTKQAPPKKNRTRANRRRLATAVVLGPSKSKARLALGSHFGVWNTPLARLPKTPRIDPPPHYRNDSPPRIP